MGNGSYVFDHSDLKSNRLQCADSGLTSCAGTLNVHFHRLESVLQSSLCCGFGSGLCCKGSGLSGTLKAKFSGGCPRNGIAFHVGNGYDRVVKSRLNVNRTFFNILSVAALFAMVFAGPLRVLALVLVL